jgi:hypothetical protein
MVADTPPPPSSAPQVLQTQADLQVGLYPIVTFQYSSTTLYQVSYHIRYLLL